MARDAAARAGWRTRWTPGDGLVRHVAGAFAGGLAQQGWRDTIDAAADADGGGYVRADGANPAPPLADADTQAVTARGAARAARTLTGDPEWTRRADAIRALLSERYGPEVMALEAGDVVVPGAGSQLGWLLWADALEPEAAARGRGPAVRAGHPDARSGCARSRRAIRTSAPSTPTTAARSGRSTPGSAGAGCAPRGGSGEAERVRDRRAARRSTGSAARPELYAVERDGSLAPIALSNRVQAWTIGARWALEHGWDGRAI